MKKWILLLVLLLGVTGIAQAIPDPSAVYCILQGYEFEIRTDEQGNQYGVCVFPDGSECSTWDYYCKCEPNGIGCWPGNFTCHWPCKEMRCKEAGESVLVSKCCEGLDEIYPAHIFDANCNKLELVGWLFLCSDCGNGICESWESKCNCPEDCAQPRIIYVDADANGLNNGSSWTDAYNYLQDALADANSGDEVRVAEGIYKPDQGAGITPGNWTATFRLINGVTLRGGYAGFGEPDPNARDVELYETILSGDLADNDVDVNDPGDLIFEPTRFDNSEHVVTGSGTGETAIIDGFIITGGHLYAVEAFSSSPWGGGGMYNESGSPTVLNCTFSGNFNVSSGGGMLNWRNSSPTLTNCTFTGNWASSGGGMLNSTNSSPTFTNCTFSGNSADIGGGMHNWSNSNPTLTNCTFSGNSARYGGGGTFNWDSSNPTLTNCTFTGNSTEGFGGGMCNQNTTTEKSGPMLISCTFSANSAPKGGNALACDSYLQMWPGKYEIRNCIFWDGGDEIWNNDGSTVTITYSDVQGGQMGVHDPYQGLIWGTGNIDTDPFFADPGYWDANGVWIEGDYHLKSQAGRWEPSSQSWVKDDVTSPCIDAGDPQDSIGLEPFPNGGIINMGAYGGTTEASKSYFGEPVCETIVAGDINGDCKVNFVDFGIMASHWLEEK